MNILLIGPRENNSTDGVIIKGIKYLLNRAYTDINITYEELRDTVTQSSNHFYSVEPYDMVVVCGTPWLWDSFQNSVKFKNLLTCLNTHSNAKRLFMGIGSCLYLKDVKSDLLERPAEVAALKEAYNTATVIVRDSLAHAKLTKAGISATLLPCPAYYCYGDEPETIIKTRNVLVFQDPTKSIAAGDWTDSEKLKIYYQNYLDFYQQYKPEVYCSLSHDINAAVNIGLPVPKVLKTADQTLALMRSAQNVLSGRVHNAVPAIVQGANTTLLPIDTRSYVVEDFKHVKDFKPYIAEYMRILQNA